MLYFLARYPSVACLAVIIICCMVFWQAVPADRKRTELVLVVAIFSNIISWAAQGIANSLSSLRPLKYDLYVYRFDELFGEPSFALGRIAMSHLWLQILLQVSYGILPTAVFALAVIYIYRRTEELRYLVILFSLNLLLAPVFYLLFPVCGPQFAFHAFPASPGALIPHPIALDAAPNGIPSVHFSTGLLLVWMLRFWKWGVALGSVYLALLAFATLASGQHYLLDLVVALPYSLAMVTAASAIEKRIIFSRGPSSLIQQPNRSN